MLNIEEPPQEAGPQSFESPMSVQDLKLLRRRAEDSQQIRLPLALAMLEEMKPEDAQLLFHELRVHQIELELQNEELRRVQMELESARERYFDLYEMAPVGYCTVNEEGRILEANLTVATLLGVPRGALIRQRLSHFMPVVHRPVFQQCCQSLDATGKSQGCELEMIKGNGTTLWVGLVVNQARAAPDGATLRVMLKDVSDRRQLDCELQQQNLELDRVRRVADKANSAKSDFLASMSHELRSPLNAILGFAQLMEAGKPPPTPMQQSAIDQIIHGGWYLLDLVNEILDLATIESGQLALVMSTESLAEVLHDCQTMISPQAASSGILINFPQFDQPCWVRADRRRLKQVLINLLSNAIKYNRPQGSVNVSWTLCPKDRVRVSVHDSGLGLAAAQLGHLFQPFNRLGQESGPQEGSGIGLVVSKRLVEMMGGSIGATSSLGVGSVFWFELALAPSP